MAFFVRSLATLFSIVAASQAVFVKDAYTVCNALNKAYPNQVAFTGLSLNGTLAYDYSQATTRYWSAANADPVNLPACVFLPTAATEVAYAVKTLGNYTTVPWAVKGGGHNPNVGFSSTSGGVLIALETMAGVSLDANNNAHVQPGARWVDVAAGLEPYNRTVVGGRLGDVGVPGLLLGGGLSFLSTQYGMAADSVVNFQVVTAAGELTNANATSNSDLFYALKGAGGQFAIVTEFTLVSYPIGRVWGGTKVYSFDKKDALINATHKLLSDYYDPKAAVITTFSTTIFNLADVVVVFYFYQDPAGPGEILSDFMAIEAEIDQTSTNRTYHDLVNANSQYSLDGMRYLIREGTLPNLPDEEGIDLYNYAFDSWYSQAKLDAYSAIDNFVWSVSFQPMPHQIANASVNAPHGVNLLGLEPLSGDHCFVEYDVSWLLATSDQAAAYGLTNITQPAQNYARSKYAGKAPTNYVSGDIERTSYNPIFMNDAMYNQDPLRSYGNATYARLAQIQKARDPLGFFSTRTGGFKFT